MWDPKAFDEREVPPMSAEMFTTLVVSRLRPLTQIEVRGGKNLELKLRVGDAERTTRLDRAYEAYRANPAELSRILVETIETVVAGEASNMPGSDEFRAIAPALYPRLVTAQQWMEKRDTGARLVIRPLAQDVGIALVIDRGTELEYVQLEAIPHWGIDAQAAYDAAMENLARTAAGAETHVTGEGIEKLLTDATPDGYAAARALLPARIAEWQAQVEGELTLGMPTHDLLLGFSRAHPAFEELRAQIAEDAESASNGLLAKLLIVRDGSHQLLEI